MLIKYKDESVETIDDVTEMEKFIQNLHRSIWKENEF